LHKLLPPFMVMSPALAARLRRKFMTDQRSEGNSAIKD